MEGLTVGQLGTPGFTDDSGTCAGSPRCNVYIDLNGDGGFDTTRVDTCVADGGGAAKSLDPVAGASGVSGLAPEAVVTGLDLVTGTAGTATVDDIKAVGITVGGHLTHTTAG